MTTVGVVDRVRLGDHVCWAYDDEAEGLDAVGRFVTTGLALGHKALCFLDTVTPSAVLADLTARGAPIGEALGDGRLRLLPASDAYRPGGHFDRLAMIASLADEAREAERQGYAGLRLVGDMGWAVRSGLPADELRRYEAEVNALFTAARVAALCLYDRRLFRPDVVRAVTAAHPAAAGPDTGQSWTPLLRAYRTTDPDGLRLVGEIDRSNGDAFLAMLDDVSGWDPTRRPAVLDVSELTFADVAAAHALVRAGESTPAGGVRIVGCRPGLRRLLDLVGQGVHGGVPGSRA